MVWKVLAVLVGFLAIAIWLTPLRFVTGLANLEASGVTASAVSGSIWNGNLNDVAVRGARLGDFNVAAQPLSFLTGRPTLAFRSNGPIVEGRIAASSNGASFDNLRGQFALTQVNDQAPSDAVVTFFNTSLDMAPNACRTASGEARVVGMISAGLPDMSGPLSCETGRLRLSLSPDSGQPGPDVDFLLDISSPGDPRVLARTDDIATQAALPSYGVEVIAP